MQSRCGSTELCKESNIDNVVDDNDDDDDDDYF
jgi:hypothetical protein